MLVCQHHYCLTITPSRFVGFERYLVWFLRRVSSLLHRGIQTSFPVELPNRHQWWLCRSEWQWLGGDGPCLVAHFGPQVQIRVISFPFTPFVGIVFVLWIPGSVKEDVLSVSVLFFEKVMCYPGVWYNDPRCLQIWWTSCKLQSGYFQTWSQIPQEGLLWHEGECIVVRGIRRGHCIKHLDKTWLYWRRVLKLIVHLR